jgi:BolA protein
MAENPNDLPTQGNKDDSPVAHAIEAKLTAAFRPLEMRIEDQSYLHKGHASAPAHHDDRKVESHFKVRLVAELFEGMSRVERQRKVNEALSEELSGPVHALSIEALAPSEAA